MRQCSELISDSPKSHRGFNGLGWPDRAGAALGLWRFQHRVSVQQLETTGSVTLGETVAHQSDVGGHVNPFRLACSFPQKHDCFPERCYAHCSSALACTSACHHATLVPNGHLARFFLLALGPSPTSYLCSLLFLRRCMIGGERL